MTPPDDPQFDANVADICTLYREAPTRTAASERVVSTDELTGVQALERAAPVLPLAPGTVERREVAYVRHGTRGFSSNHDVASGQAIAPSCGPTRTEAAFLAHAQRTLASDPQTTRWHIVVDHRDSHRSTSLVCFVATASGLDLDLGVKG